MDVQGGGQIALNLILVTIIIICKSENVSLKVMMIFRNK